MTVIGVANQSGSAGKTALVVNAAALYARLTDRPSRVVDLDPQANASHALGQHDPDDRPTVSDVLFRGAKLADAERDVDGIPGLTVVPARRGELEGADVALAKVLGGEQRLRLALQTEGAAADGVTTWLDCPGSLSTLTVSALVAADAAITVFAPQEKEAGGLKAFERTVQQVAAAYNPRLRLAAIVPSIVPSGAGRYYRDVLRQVEAGWGGLVTPPIRRSVRVPESYSEQSPLILLAPDEGVTEDIADVVDYLIAARVLPAA